MVLMYDSAMMVSLKVPIVQNAGKQQRLLKVLLKINKMVLYLELAVVFVVDWKMKSVMDEKGNTFAKV